MKRNLLEQIKMLSAFSPTGSKIAGIVKGVAIDRLEFLSAAVLVSIGATSGTPTSFTVNTKIQHSDTDVDGDFIDFKINDVLIETEILTAIDTSTYIDFDLSGAKKYIRSITTIAFVGGTTPEAFIGVTFALGDSIRIPVE